MSNEALTWAFKQELPMTEKFVLVALADYADEAHSCFPSHATTARRVGASRDTVRRAVRRLEVAGFVRVEQVDRDNGSSTSNRYYLAVDNPENQGGADCTGGRGRTGARGGSAPGRGAVRTGAGGAGAPPLTINEPSGEPGKQSASGGSRFGGGSQRGVALPDNPWETEAEEPDPWQT